MDDELRALERRWRESGTPDDAARLLMARLRAGDLDPRDVAAVEVTLTPAVEAHLSALERAALDLASADPLVRVRRDGLRPAVVVGAPDRALLERALTGLAPIAAGAARSELRIALRQQLVGEAVGRGRVRRQTSCPGDFAALTLLVRGHPGPEPLAFTNTSELSPEWISVVRDELPLLALDGDGTGAPFVGADVTLVDGLEHPVDSRARSFRRAAAVAWSDALRSLRLVVMEPRARFSLHAAADVLPRASVALAGAEAHIEASPRGALEGDLPLSLLDDARERLAALQLSDRVRLEARGIRRYAPMAPARADAALAARRAARA